MTKPSWLRRRFLEKRKQSKCKICRHPTTRHLVSFLSNHTFSKTSGRPPWYHMIQFNIMCKWCHRIYQFYKSKHLPKRVLKTMQLINCAKRTFGCCAMCFTKIKKGNEMCFDLDHYPHYTKNHNVSHMARKKVPWDLIRQEIAKCRLLCCHCHLDYTLRKKD